MQKYFQIFSVSLFGNVIINIVTLTELYILSFVKQLSNSNSISSELLRLMVFKKWKKWKIETKEKGRGGEDLGEEGKTAREGENCLP